MVLVETKNDEPCPSHLVGKVLSVHGWRTVTLGWWCQSRDGHLGLQPRCCSNIHLGGFTSAMQQNAFNS